MNDRDLMAEALVEARAALENDDVPIGAVAALDGHILGRAHNERELRRDPTAHAEILVLRQAAEKVGGWRLNGVTVYVTVEPCPMCAGALVAGRVHRLVYGTPDERAGAAYSIYNIPQDPRLNHRMDITPGVLEEECSALLQDFFRARRGKPEIL
jgi:tRNA(adenine34) deaminase